MHFKFPIVMKSSSGGVTVIWLSPSSAYLGTLPNISQGNVLQPVHLKSFPYYTYHATNKHYPFYSDLILVFMFWAAPKTSRLRR